MTTAEPARSGGQRVVVVGETLVDIVVRADGRRAEHVGGSPANVARGLARLGVETTLLTVFGDDARGRVVARSLEGAGVRVLRAGRPAVSTSTATARLDENGSAAYTFDIAWELGDVALPPGEHLHVGSIAVTMAPGAENIARWVAERDEAVTVSYDVNVRPNLMSPRAEAVARIESMIARSDIVKMSVEDLAWLRPGIDPAAAVHELLDSGPALVALTFGGAGASAATHAGSVRVPGREVDLVDTIGAGDAFMSGLLFGLVDRGLLTGEGAGALRTLGPEKLGEVVEQADLAAALTVARAGAQPPTLDELRAPG